MTDPTDNPTADITWMRQLAEEGSRTPMQGGSILMAAGLIYGITSLVHWGHVTGLLEPRFAMAGAEWLIATALFLVINFVLVARIRRTGGVRTAANRAIGAIWAGVGCGIFTLFVSMAVVSFRNGADQTDMIFWLVPSIIMVFYGMGWGVTAAMLKSGPLWALGIASFVAAPLLGAMAGQYVQYLGYAAALFLLMALPGFLLMRSAKQA
ncbi:hypothetical protein [Brevundimonas sp.]|uniref:hypothetical protein n=1 Tax=Brevundimonas sp. TaxID=1871086 RepID=UPI0035648723